MLTQPFDVVRCSWPRPVAQCDRQWISDPEWDAPAMPLLPEAHLDMADDQMCWMVDWREYFRCRQCTWDGQFWGDLPGFQVTFSLRMRESGVLRFWADDGCIIRHARNVVHEDRCAHALLAHELPVRASERHSPWLPPREHEV